MNKNICRMVTDRLIERMEQGEIPWRKPWIFTGKGAISHSTGKPYSLLNQIILPGAGEYITFNQCSAEGGKVKKGVKGYPVVFWKQNTVKELNENGEEITRYIPILRYYTVFRIEDCEGISPKWNSTDSTRPGLELEPIEAAEAVINNYAAHNPALRIEREEQTDKAYYSPGFDCVVVPALEQYAEVAEYYSTLFHELTHSTGHKSRLNRLTKTAAFGSAEYSKEELTAEIGAATLNTYCSIDSDKAMTNSAAYLQSWIKALKNDPTMIITAAGKAEKAVNYILDGLNA